MQDFEAIRSHVGASHALRHNAPYLISFDVAQSNGRQQGMYLAEMEDERGRRYLRVSTPVGPLSSTDAQRCLRFNWEQRTGFLAIRDLDGVPYLHVCENCPYEVLSTDELDRLIRELGELGDRLENAMSDGADAA